MINPLDIDCGELIYRFEYIFSGFVTPQTQQTEILWLVDKVRRLSFRKY